MRKYSIGISFFLVLVSSLSIAAYVSNDPLYSQQWYLNGNNAPLGGGFSIGFEPFKAESIDEPTETVTVILGSGIDTKHEDLQGSVWKNPQEIEGNFIDDDNNGFVDDVNGINAALPHNTISAARHQETIAASVIAAQQGNNRGITGLSSNNKIITCDIFDNEGLASVESIKTCISYIISLKTQKGVNISSILLSFGIQSGADDLVEELKVDFARLEEADILIVAPVVENRDPINIRIGPNLDTYYHYPSSYLMNNVIPVSGLYYDKSFAGRGENSVFTVAPSSYIKGASPLRTLLPTDDVKAQFEPEDISLDDSQGVEISNEFYVTGISSLKLRRYSDDTFLVLPEVDLSDFDSEPFIFSFDYLNDTPLAYNIEYFDQQLSQWRSLYRGSTFANEWINESLVLNTVDGMSANLASIQLRIHFPFSLVDEDIYSYIDNIKITSSTNASEGYTYRFGNGTYYAAAQVAGAIALLKSQEHFSNIQIRNLLISSGSTIDLGHIVQGVSVSNKLLTLYGENQNGLFNCQDQRVAKRLYPSSEQWVAKMEGEEIAVKGVSLNCSESGEDLVFTDSYDDKNYTSSDDGSGLDYEAGDGFNITTIPLQGVGEHRIALPGDRDLPVWVFAPYGEAKPHQLIWFDVSTLGKAYSSALTFKLNFAGINSGFSDCYQLLETGVFAFERHTTPYGEVLEPDLTCYEEDLITTAHISQIPMTGLPASSEATVHNAKEVEESERTFVANGIDDPFKQGIAIDVLRVDDTASETVYRLKYTPRTIGPIGKRVFILQMNNNPDLDFNDYYANAQLMFFEENSTLVISYGDISEDYLEVSLPTKIKIGSGYTFQLNEKISPNTTYVIKSEREFNSPPIQTSYTVTAEHTNGLTLDLDSAFQDADQDVLFYRLAEDIAGIKLDPFGSLTLDAETYFKIGDDVNLKVIVSDGESQLQSELILTIVQATNLPPVFELSLLELKTSEPFTIELNDYVSDPEGDNVNISVETVLPFLFDESSSVLSGTLSKSDFPLVDGYIAVTVSDGQNTSTYNVPVNLAYENHPPYVEKSIRFLQVTAGERQTFDLSGWFHDVDNDVLEYSEQVQYANINTTENGTTELVLEAQSSGGFDFIVLATDVDGAEAEVEVKLEVLEAEQKTREETPKKSSGGGGALYLLLPLMCLLLFRKNIKASELRTRF